MKKAPFITRLFISSIAVGAVFFASYELVSANSFDERIAALCSDCAKGGCSGNDNTVCFVKPFEKYNGCFPSGKGYKGWMECGVDIKALKKAYKDAKKDKQNAWAHYLDIKKKTKIVFKARKKNAWESYLKKKGNAFKIYKDIKAEAKEGYLKTKKNAWNDYLSSKKTARKKYDNVKTSYEVARAAYKKCRKDGGSKKDCKDKRDTYKTLRDDRDAALQDYKEIRADAKSAYESKRDEAKGVYMKTRDAAKKIYMSDKKKARARYDATKLEVKLGLEKELDKPRENYEKLKKVYLEAKEIYYKERKIYLKALEAYNNARGK
ncbi:MAG: hypothetical protein QF858_03020 [Candidatus Pacebacteria bacterium]|jgi:hypothetical protein|nr:hypothetical protein [Candidatus Paceibacterota bacterium]